MNTPRLLVSAALAVAAVAMAGCGGGGNASSSGTGGSGSGGSGAGSGGGSTAQYSLTGVAASGDPLAGATVTLKDQNGSTQTATTATDGSFSINVTGLTAPFLLQVVSGSTTYYSASASAASTNPTANIDQYTDLAMRAYFAALNGSDVSSAFASVSAATVLPAQTDLNNLADALNDMLQLTLNADSVASPASFNIFTTPFTANETAFDALLHDTTYTVAGSPTSGSSYTISTPGANGEVLTQGGTVAVSSGQIDFSGTNTNQTNGTTTASTSSFDTISVAAGTSQQQTDEQAALTGIQTLWSQLVATAQSKGAALSASDLAPYFDANFMESGLDAADFETYLAERLVAYVTGGQQVTGAIGQVYAFSDAAGSPIQATVQTLVDVSTSGSSYSVDMSQNEGTAGGLGLGYIQESDGSYALYGNQNEASTALEVISTNRYNNCVILGGAVCSNLTFGSSAAGLVLEGTVPFAAPYGGTGTGDLPVSSITIANTGSSAELPSCNPSYALGAAPVTLSEEVVDGTAVVATDNYGQQVALFLPAALTCGAVETFPSPFPPAGTEYQVTYTETGGATQSATLFMNSQSSESLQLQSIDGEPPAGFLMANNNGASGALPGSSLSFGWPLPTTFALRSIGITVEALDSASCSVVAATTSFLSPTATGGTVTLPNPDPGLGTNYYISITFNGADAELVSDVINLYSSADSPCPL